jgi:hypothetical protein
MLFGAIAEVNDTEHVAMVCDGHCRHPVFDSLLQEVMNPAGAIKQTVFGMNMQVNKIDMFQNVLPASFPLDWSKPQRWLFNWDKALAGTVKKGSTAFSVLYDNVKMVYLDNRVHGLNPRLSPPNSHKEFPQHLERPLSALLFHLKASASKMMFLHPNAFLRANRDVDESNRLGGLVPGRSGYPGYGNTDSRAGDPAGAFGHCARRLSAHRPHPPEQIGAHPQQFGLGFIAVDDIAAFKIVRTSGNIGDSMGDQAAGAGLGGHQPSAGLPQDDSYFTLRLHRESICMIATIR